MPDAKPADFFLGATEFFVVLLPGAALVYLVQPWTTLLVPSRLLPANQVQAWAAFAILAYLTGHLLQGVSSKLDGLYLIYLRTFLPKQYRATKAIETEQNELLRDDKDLASTLLARAHASAAGDSSGTSLYDWCLSYTRLRSASAASEVDRLQTASKFFRSLVPVLLVGAVDSAIDGLPVTTIAALLLAFFAAWRFCGLRWVATQRVYEYYLLLRSSQPEVKMGAI